MQAGLLTGAFTAARAKTLPANDWRSRNAEFTGSKLEANLELAATMQAVGKRHGTSAAAVAIAWTLAWPGVTGAIVGAREPAQVDGWIDAATLHLRKADLDEIALPFRRAHGRWYRVATKYMNLTRRYFARMGVTDYRIVESLGATEGTPASGTAELIVDITTTGATLEANGLRILDDGVILKSEANLVASSAAPWGPVALDARREIESRLGLGARG